MAKIVDRRLDIIQKVEVVVLEDEFGAQLILQHPLLLDGYDAAAKEAEALQEMKAAEAKFKERAKQRGHKL